MGWPENELSLSLLAGAMEAGRDLYLLGHFGGFGGCLIEVHLDLESAKKAARKKIITNNFQTHCSVYKLTVSLEDEMLDVYEKEKS